MVQPQLISFVIGSHHAPLQPDPSRAQDCSHRSTVKPVAWQRMAGCLLENTPACSKFSSRSLPPCASGPARGKKSRVGGLSGFSKNDSEQNAAGKL